MRIKFARGLQRAFLDEVILRLNAPSLRGLLQFGFDVSYSALKNYYVEDRLMSEELVLDFCEVGGIDFEGLDVLKLEDNWGQRKGGESAR